MDNAAIAMTSQSSHLHSWTTPSTAWIYIGLALYLVLVRVLRYQRVQALDRARGNVSKLTPAQAQEMIYVHLTYDMPFLTGKSLAFALFKTYGIPTISQLLFQTKELAKPELSSKRYVDTALLIITWLICPLNGPGSGASCPTGKDEVDPRGAIAVARTNWLHAHYPSISNDDYLYTLSTFIFEPVGWAGQYEWRSLSAVECEALYVFWAEIGRRMGIRDIPPNFDKFREWSETYERDNMVPNEITAFVGEQTIALVLHKVPGAFGLKSFGRKVVICLLEERLRKAMMLPPASPLLKKAVRGILRARAFIIRNFFLPRIKPREYVDQHPEVKSDQRRPRLHPKFYENDPWYYPESTGLQKLWETAQITLGLARPEDFPGPKHLSHGYRLEELGPKAFTNSAHEKVMKMAEEIQGAPVTGPWSLNYAGAGCPMTGLL